MDAIEGLFMMTEAYIAQLKESTKLLEINLDLMKENKKLRDALGKEKSAEFIHELLQEK